MPLNIKCCSCSAKTISRSDRIGKFPDGRRKVVNATVWGGVELWLLWLVKLFLTGSRQLPPGSRYWYSCNTSYREKGSFSPIKRRKYVFRKPYHSKAPYYPRCTIKSITCTWHALLRVEPVSLVIWNPPQKSFWNFRHRNSVNEPWTGNRGNWEKPRGRLI